jgi:hypothetical protein
MEMTPVTKPGTYDLSADGEVLVLTEAKPLPARDQPARADEVAQALRAAGDVADRRGSAFHRRGEDRGHLGVQHEVISALVL